MAVTRSFETIVTALLTFVRAANSRINLVVGSAIRDLLQSVAQEFAKAYVLQEWARRQGSTSLLRKTLTDTAFKDQLRRALPSGTTAEDVDDLISEAIDSKASNVGTSRTDAKKSVVLLTLQRSTPATGINISAGTVSAQTSSTPPVQFTTTETVTNRSTTLDPLTNLYTIDVVAECTLAGVIGNVAAGSIRTLQPPIADFSSVTNKLPSEGGADEQSDLSLLDAIEESLLGLNINTVGGYPVHLKEEFALIEDAEVVEPSNPLLTRISVGGADIYVIGTSLKSFSESYSYAGTGVVLRKQPVSSVDSVVQGSTSFVQGIDYQFVKDTGNFAGSVQAQDQIVFLSGVGPAPGALITITYRQNKLIEDAQTFLTDVPLDTVVGADVLIKEGVKVLVNMKMKITPAPEFSKAAVEATVSNNLAQFLSGRKLGQGAFYSDLIGVVEVTEGVDRVDVPFALLARDGQTGNADVPVAENEYPRAGTITFI